MNWDRLSLPLLGFLLLAIPHLFFVEGEMYLARVFHLMVLYATLAIALNIVFGHTDQLLLFSGAVAAIGSYFTIILAQSLGISPWVTLPIGALVAGLTGAFVTYVGAIQKMSIIVISILTLALQLSIMELITGLRDITGGVTGIRFTGLNLEPVENLLGLHEMTITFWVISAILLATLLLYRHLRRSKFGLAFEMIRQDETAAEATGLNVVRYKTIAGFISTFTIGFVGPFFAQISGYVTPGLYTFNQIDVMILIILVVGGIRTMYGPIIGSVLIITLTEQLRSLAEYQPIVYGALLIALFLFFREGIVRYIDSMLETHSVTDRISDII